MKVKPGSTTNIQKNAKSSESHGLGDSDSDDEGDIVFDPTPLYKQILEFLKPGETVSKTLCRLGKHNCYYATCIFKIINKYKLSQSTQAKVKRN